MEGTPPTPMTVPTQSASPPRRRFLSLVLVGTALMLADAVLTGFIGLAVSFSIADTGALANPALLNFLPYLYIPAVLVGGVGAFLAFYGIALGLRELLARHSPSGMAPGIGETEPHPDPGPPDRRWRTSPYQFVLVGAILVLLGSAVSLTMTSLSMFRIYPSLTAGSIGDYVRVTTSISFASGLLQVVGTVLAYLGIAVALDRTTS